MKQAQQRPPVIAGLWLCALVLMWAMAPAMASAMASAQAADLAAAELSYLHVVERGDTLIGLGRRLLAEPARWPEVARHNQLRNPDLLAVGSTLQWPLRLMVTTAEPAAVLAVAGDARSAATPLQAGQLLKEGSEVWTGADGQVTVRLVDGTLLQLRADSRLQLDVSRRVRNTPAPRTAVRLDQGRVEVEAAPAAGGQPGFQVRTPQGVLGVRGTEFRVAADAAAGLTRGEVLSGVVAVDGAAGPAAGQRVAAGYGTIIAADGQVAAPVPLLPAPPLDGLPTLQEQPLLRFGLVPMAGAAAYRAQVLAATSAGHVLAEIIAATPELRFAGLADGDYVLRVRGIDERGLEGRDADHRFVLKARPEPPLLSLPPPGAVRSAGRVEFAWASVEQAQSYRLQLSQREDFAERVQELADLAAPAAAIDSLPAGTYHWRVASVQGTADRGPWGAPRRFELRALPAALPPPQVSETGLSLAFDALPGQRFELQVARDAAFASVIMERSFSQPKIDLPLPGSGRFHLRLRAIDADGFIGPWSATQRFEVPNCLRDSAGSCVQASGQAVRVAD